MKLLNYILECEGATPANTMGMGNPMAPGTDGEPGSGDIPAAKISKKKKRKSLKEYLDEGLLDKTNKTKTLDPAEVLLDMFRKKYDLTMDDFNYLKEFISSHETTDFSPVSDQRKKDRCIIVYHPLSRTDNEMIEVRKKNDNNSLVSVMKYISYGNRVASFYQRSKNMYTTWNPKWRSIVVMDPEYLDKIVKE